MGSGVDLVVKFGGSLQSRADLRGLCERLDKSLEGIPSMIVPGGGRFADEVRRFDASFSLSQDTSHWMAVLAVDQSGWLLADLIPRGVAVNSPEEAARACGKMDLPVFLPGMTLLREDPLPKSWEVTSDSISCWAAWRTGAGRLLLLKDSLPEKFMTVEELSDNGWLDRAFPEQFRAFCGDAWIGNGRFPEEAVSGLEGLEIRLRSRRISA